MSSHKNFCVYGIWFCGGCQTVSLLSLSLLACTEQSYERPRNVFHWSSATAGKKAGENRKDFAPSEQRLGGEFKSTAFISWVWDANTSSFWCYLVNELSKTLLHIQKTLEECIPLMNKLNNLLPEGQRMEPFMLKNASSHTHSSSSFVMERRSHSRSRGSRGSIQSGLLPVEEDKDASGSEESQE